MEAYEGEMKVTQNGAKGEGDHLQTVHDRDSGILQESLQSHKREPAVKAGG